MASRERATPRRRVGRESPPPRRPESAYPRIYAVVSRIPRGRVATYGRVAAEAGMPHALPQGSVIPWHRVVAAGGRLSLGKLDPSSAVTQRLRLEHEGVRFDGRGCVDMERFTWKPRARAVRRERP